MATVNWPSTLPGPNASSFGISGKPFGRTMGFESGRARTARNRATPVELGSSGYGVKFVAQFSFAMTLDEHDIFRTFYDTYWATFAPNYANKLNFTLAGHAFLGWPESDVKERRLENTWLVTFSFEVESWEHVYSSFSNDETHPKCPTIPAVLGMTNGRSVKIVSRDRFDVSEDLNVMRLPGLGKNYLSVEFEFQLFEFPTVPIVLDWWARYLKFGALPFKFSSEHYDFGDIGGRSATKGYYCGKFTSPPTIEFSGYGGTVSFSGLVWIPLESIFVYYLNTKILDSQYAGSVDLELYDAASALSSPSEFTVFDGRALGT